MNILSVALRKLLWQAVLVLFLCGCAVAGTPNPATLTPSVTPTPEPPAFRIIGYVTDAVTPAAIQYDKLTHINYAFLTPNSDGTFKNVANPWKIKEIVRLAHEQGVKVLISVGGWGWDAEFEAVAADSHLRSIFVSELVKFVNEYGLDGADIDWEFPDPGQSAQDFLALMQSLRAALPDKLLTAAVIAVGDYYGLGIPAETFELVDSLNIMAYDGGSPHSPYEYAVAALDYWLGRGLPSEKAVLGVPFYAHPISLVYRKIVQADPQAAYLDEYTYAGTLLDYNGIPTMQRKTQLAMQRASGVMIWTLEMDTTELSASLLNAIYQTAQGANNP